MTSRAHLAGLAVMLAAAAAASAGAAAGSGLEPLEQFLESTRSMRATFRQEVMESDGRVVEVSSGRMALKRPVRFRWDYEQPYERAVVADGARLWLYEADLEQATVRPLEAGLGETPAALLTGDRTVLERFEHVRSWRDDGLAWIRLKPLSAEADFESVAIGFADRRPVRLEIADRLGQRTRIVLSDVELNPPLDDELFTFEVPQGVDVIREGGT